MSDQSDRLQRIATSLHEPEHVLEAMHEPPRSRPLSTPLIAPRTDTERRMADIWRHVLGTDEVGVEDDFFALGGHSLLAVHLLGSIRDAFGVELAIAAVFLNAFTVAELARHVDLAVIREASSDDLSAVLDTIGELSDDEVAAMLTTNPVSGAGDPKED